MSHLIGLLQEFGLGLVFLNVLVEQAGVPVPAYPTLIVAGAFAAGDPKTVLWLVATAVVAVVIADTFWYITGRRYGLRVLRTLCRISLSPDSCVTQTESIFTRFGAASMLFAKFIPGFASVATAMAGAVGLRYWKFLLFDTLGAILWVGVAVALGQVFRDAIAEILSTLEDLGKYGLVLVVVALAAYGIAALLADWRALGTDARAEMRTAARACYEANFRFEAAAARMIEVFEEAREAKKA